MSEQKIVNRWQKAIEHRRKELPELFKPSQSLRLIHQEGPPLRMDKAGEVGVLGWWSNQPPTASEMESIQEILSDLPVTSWYLQWRPDKGTGHSPQIVLQSEPPTPDVWNFTENDLIYEGRKQQGDAFGLFLDQRDNRQWVLANSKGQRILNLFAFTCGFSVAAAKGGASDVVSVDLSKKYLDWGQQNFSLNQLDPARYKFIKMDSQEYLQYCQRKNLQFDLIICDPPTFSRNGKKVFKIEKDLEQLAQACRQVLAPGGALLFSTNCEKLSPRDVRQRLQSLGAAEVTAFPAGLDFDFDTEFPILKSYLCRF